MTETNQIELTKEQIARHYSAAMDSVNLINALVSKASLTEEDQARIKANKDHLEIMVAKDFWTDEDLQPLHNAIAA